MDHGGRQEGPLRSTDDQARLARVERQLAALQTEVAELKRHLAWPGEAGGELRDDRLSLAFSEVALTVFVAIDRRPPGPAVPDQSRIVSMPPARVVTATPVVVVHAPPGLDWARARPDPLVSYAESLLAGVKERLREAAAEQIVNVVWKEVNWQVTDFGGFAGAADLLGHLDSMAHRAVGTWLAGLARAVGVPGSIAVGAGAVIGCLVPLPIDRPLETASLAIAITGVAVFTIIVGGKVMVCASFKELVHKALTDLVPKELRSTLSPARPPESQPAPGRTGEPAQPGRGRTGEPAQPGRGRTGEPAQPGTGPTREPVSPWQL